MEDMDVSYKERHEKFVSGNEGSSVIEIILVCCVCPVSVFLRHALISWIYSKEPVPKINAFLIDFIAIVLPGLCASTLFSSNLDVLLTTLFITALLLIIISEKELQLNATKQSSDTQNILDVKISNYQPFITHFRAYTGIATAVFILAVDFSVFPRRFCKTETYGTGLMDVGVGGFMVANGIVSPEARGKFKTYSTLCGKLKQILHAFKSTIPLWVLGFGRTLAVKGVDYHEHVSEYGVHWNFFFTLAIVKVLSTIVLVVFPVQCSPLLSIATILSYQYFLKTTNLKEFIIMGSDGVGGRNGILDANREGIFSCIGYLSIYFASVAIGMYLRKPRVQFSEWLHTFGVLCLVDVVLWFLLCFIQAEVEPVSRRMGNLGFVLWMMAHQLCFLLCFFLVDIIAVILRYLGILKQLEPSPSQFCILEAVNRNGLVYFLLANVMTGLVNLSVQTMYASDFVAYTILTLYMLCLSGIVALLHIKNITLKFW